MTGTQRNATTSTGSGATTSTTSRAERTRDRIQEVAVALFAEQGYDATTVDQIAAAARVSHMTFFRHFGSKERVLLDDPFDPALAAAVVAAPAELPPTVRICEGFRAALDALDLPAQDQVRARLRIAAAVPALTARMWGNTLETQRVITEALVADGTPADEAAVAAAAVMAALAVALQRWAAEDADPSTSMVETLVAALDVVQGRSPR